MLTANQFHKQSGLKMEFQDFLGRMKETFGENFMEQVNAGKVKLQEVQSALGLKKEPTEKQKSRIEARKNVRVKAVKKAATGDMKCASCSGAVNATGSPKSTKIVRNVALVVGIGAVVFWAMKNRK